ncbi:MAG: helical backbone metal receptor [Bacteroidota bacterium]
MIISDQIGRTVHVPALPQRIVSLVPSITELLIDLELTKRLVGRTKFCVHPKHSVKKIAKVGGTKQVSLEKVAALQPDLIIANQEENDEGQIKALMTHFPVWVSQIPTFAAGLEMIQSVGQLTQTVEKANNIIERSSDAWQKLYDAKRSIKTAYLIWQKPYMTIGNDTYIHDVLRQLGFVNVFSETTRYPTFTLSDLQQRQPHLILLSSEPFPFKQQHLDDLQSVFPSTSIRLVDGEAFSWYGTRFLKTAGYLQELTNSTLTNSTKE